MQCQSCAAAGENEDSGYWRQQTERSLDQRRHRDADGERRNRGRDALLRYYRFHGRPLLPGGAYLRSVRVRYTIVVHTLGMPRHSAKLTRWYRAGILWKYMMFLRLLTSTLHVPVKIPTPDRGVDVAEGPLVFRLPRRRDEPAHRSAIK